MRVRSRLLVRRLLDVALRVPDARVDDSRDTLVVPGCRKGDTSSFGRQALTV